MELQQAIRRFIALDEESLQDIASCFKPLHLTKGTYWLKAGQICTQVGWVKEGLLRTWYKVDGEEITHWISEEGYFDTSLSSFSFKTPSRWNLQAITDCELLVLDCDDHRELLHKYTQWRIFESQLLIFSYLGLEERMFSQLHQTAEERYEKLLIERPELAARAPLQHLASMLGMKPETLSRLRKKQTTRIS
ncbi:MAG: Crp/Fnr family transcriptional regulator [Bacteroidota bacterium]